jgi:hypothetical protein
MAVRDGCEVQSDRTGELMLKAHNWEATVVEAVSNLQQCVIKVRFSIGRNFVWQKSYSVNG